MGFTETMGKELIQSMSPEERKHFVDTLLAEFLRTMPLEERKEMLDHILPKLIDDALVGMTHDEKRNLIEKVVNLMKTNMAHAKE
jgi:hypothetical protein